MPNVEKPSPDVIKNIVNLGEIYLVIVLVLALIISIVCYKLLQKKMSIYSLLQGAITIWVVHIVISSILLKSASYIFSWPAIFLLIGLVIRNIVKQEKHINTVTFFTFAAVALLSCVIFIPLCYLLYLAMLPGFIPVLAGIAAFPLILVALTGIVFLKKKCLLAQKRISLFLIKRKRWR